MPVEEPPEWVRRVEGLPDWALSSLGLADCVRMVWHDWDMVVEVADPACRGFALRQVDWWLIVEITCYCDAPETYDPDDEGPSSFLDGEYEEWAAMGAEDRYERLLDAARSAVAASSLVELPVAMNEAHVGRMFRVHGHAKFNVDEMSCLLLATVLGLDEQGSDEARRIAEDSVLAPQLARGMQELRSALAEHEYLPPYLWQDHPDPGLRTEWFEFVSREWSQTRGSFRPWSDPFPIDRRDLSSARRHIEKRGGEELRGRDPVERRIVRVVRQEL